MRVLVTGGAGFIGSTTVPRLRAAGHEVLAPAAGEVDLLDPAAVDAVVGDAAAEVLLHLAWYARAGWPVAPDNVAWAEATLRLARRFVEGGGRRAVIVGSCAEYGPSEVACREDVTPIAPDTLYGATKAGVHQALAGWAATGAFELAWPRVFAVYGPGEAPDRLVPSVARAVLAGEPARCTVGTQVRDFLHVADVADVLVRLVEGSFTGAVNVGAGQGVTVAEVARWVAELAGGPDLLELGALGPGGGPARVVADTERLGAALGWRPAIGLDEGLADAVAWWRAPR